MSEAKQVPCPTCEREFDSETGMKIHHKRTHGESLAGYEFECDWCEETFTRDTKVDYYETEFCSNECQQAWQSSEREYERDRVSLECDYCESEYDVIPSIAERGSRFCSKECKADWQSENRRGENHPRWNGGPAELTCQNCGDDYVVQSTHSDQSRFCSLSCMGEFRNTGSDNPQWKESVTHTCEVCGVEFDTKPSIADSRRFCSYECQGEWRRQEVHGENHPRWNQKTLTCEICGEEFSVVASEASRRRFCSNECRGIGRSQELQGQDNPNWRGGGNVREALKKQLPGPSWRLIREERTGNRCELCDRHENEVFSLHLHHIIPLLDGGTNGPWNLMTLCVSCHNSVETYTRQYTESILPPELLE